MGTGEAVAGVGHGSAWEIGRRMQGTREDCGFYRAGFYKINTF